MDFTLDYSQSGFSNEELATSGASAMPNLAGVELIHPVMAKLPLADGVVLVGIGGSSLGARAVAQALGVDDRLMTLEAVDDRALTRVGNQLAQAYSQGKRYVVVIVSKSGSTLETITNAALLEPIFKKLESEYQSRIIIVTDQGSPLWQQASQAGYTVVASPAAVAGRFSLFTATALVPLVLLGVDTAALCAGATEMQQSCIKSDSPAVFGAALAALHLTKGRALHALFSTHPQLDGLAQWWRQLIAESLNKKSKGITPLISTLTDLHVMTQRYFQGAPDVFTTFLNAPSGGELTMPKDKVFAPALSGRAVHDIAQAIVHGVQKAYQNQHLPYASITFSSLTAHALGEFCMLKMLETVAIAHLLGVEPFDQPGVELYKKEVKKLLGV